MKKTLKHCMAFLLAAALLITCFAACGGKDGSSASSSENSSSKSEASKDESSSEDESSSASTDTGTGLPLTEESVTLKMWFQITSACRGNMTDYNDNDFYKWLE